MQFYHQDIVDAVCAGFRDDIKRIMEGNKMKTMRAKLQIASVTKHSATCEQLKFHAVSAKAYPEDGMDEDNSFAKYSPSVALDMTISNPALIGKFEPGQTFYVDFSPAS